MKSTTTDQSMAAARATDISCHAVPDFDELRALTSEPGEKVVIRGVDWDVYERLVDSIPEDCRIRVNYDGKDVELMSPSLPHDDYKGLLGRLVEIVAEECEIPMKSAGQTTWKRPQVSRGLEADESYFFVPEKLDAVARSLARGSSKIADYPDPDLGIEVDRSPPLIDRPGIYAALRVAEVWRFEVSGRQVIIERLGDDLVYHPVTESGFLPIRADEIFRWVGLEDSRDESSWARRLRAWVRDELAARRAR
jgi:Uma2 family endonuclease